MSSKDAITAAAGNNNAGFYDTSLSVAHDVYDPSVPVFLGSTRDYDHEQSLPSSSSGSGPGNARAQTKMDEDNHMINMSVEYLKMIEKESRNSRGGDSIMPSSSESPSSDTSTSKQSSVQSKLTRSVRVTSSTSRKSKRKRIGNRFDQDEEGCCFFCPCWYYNVVDNNGNDENDEEQPQRTRKRQRRRLFLFCSPLRCLQSWQSKLYQHPLFYRLSLQRQQVFPRSRRRASDPTFEQQQPPSVLIRSSSTRSFFPKIHYKSLMMGMVLAFIIVRCSNSGAVMLNSNGEPLSLYGALVPVDESLQQSGDWQQMQHQQIFDPQPQVHYNNNVNVEKRNEDEIPLEVLQRETSAVDRIESYLRGHPPIPIPSEVASTTGLALDSSVNNVAMKAVELEQMQQQGEVEEEQHKSDRTIRVQEMWDKAEEEVTQHQQQLNTQLAMQQEQQQQQQPQEQPQEQTPQPETTYTVEFNNIKNTWDPHERNDIALLWHVPASGSSVIRHAVGGCHRLVQASGFGLRDGHDADDQVGVFYPTEGSPFVNIDSTTIEGIRRAASMRFADAQVADVVVSPLIYETNELFTRTSQGRFFAVFSHPVERAVRLFYSMKEVQPALREWTMERYCRSTYVENNFLTRHLSNRLEGELDEIHYRKAVEIIRDKFLVGLTSKMDESLDRFEKYFRWTYRVHPESQESCRNRILLEDAAAEKKIKNRTPKEGEPNWAWLLHHNAFDLRLYAYIEKLFEEQAVFVKGATENFRNADTTCCRCEPATFPAFELDGDDDDEIPDPDENMDQYNVGEDASTFEGGIRLIRRLPSELTSALFVPCTMDDFWLND